MTSSLPRWDDRRVNNYPSSSPDEKGNAEQTPGVSPLHRDLQLTRKMRGIMLYRNIGYGIYAGSPSVGLAAIYNSPSVADFVVSIVAVLPQAMKTGGFPVKTAGDDILG